MRIRGILGIGLTVIVTAGAMIGCTRNNQNVDTQSKTLNETQVAADQESYMEETTIDATKLKKAKEEAASQIASMNNVNNKNIYYNWISSAVDENSLRKVLADAGAEDNLNAEIKSAKVEIAEYSHIELEEYTGRLDKATESEVIKNILAEAKEAEEKAVSEINNTASNNTSNSTASSNIAGNSNNTNENTSSDNNASSNSGEANGDTNGGNEAAANNSPDSGSGADNNSVSNTGSNSGSSSGVADSMKIIAMQAFELQNRERTSAGLSTLAWDEGLYQGCVTRASEINVNFSHTRPNGTSCFSAYTTTGCYGENIAAGQTNASMVISSWMGSEGHKANILKSTYKTGAIAVIYIPGSTYGYYWCAAFGC